MARIDNRRDLETISSSPTRESTLAEHIEVALRRALAELAAQDE